MVDDARIPAATYLRMSTERQQYSLLNQSEVIAQYAVAHGFLIVKSYSDAAKTGVIFRKRTGLQSLIQDVVQGDASFKAILVYDVSRWGRFQDTDESAHYEFLCKSAGIPVHYCAEPFTNDTGLSSLIMKSLKRVMAGEYSRELGVKIFNAQRKLACLGFRQGGQPGYGLRRLLVSAEGKPKQILNHRERKSLATDRVIQIPGSRAEVRCVRKIFRLFIQERMNFLEITRELNRQGMKYLGGTKWEQQNVKLILTHPKYAGINVYGRTSARLYTRAVEVPRSEWAIRPGAFKAIVEPETFDKAQRILATFTRNKSNEELIEVLREILAKQGKLNPKLIESTPGAASSSTLRSRFGSISQAYELVGYVDRDGYSRKGRIDELRTIRRMREALLNDIVAQSEGRVKIEDRGTRFATRLLLRGGQRVAVIVSRFFHSYKDTGRWRIQSLSRNTRLVTVVARLNRTNDSFMDYFVVPPIRNSRMASLMKDDPRLNQATRLDDLREFRSAVASASKRNAPPIVWAYNEKSIAVATKDQLRRLGMFTKRVFLHQGMNQRTLEKIWALTPVRPSKLEKCLKLLHQFERERERPANES